MTDVLLSACNIDSYPLYRLRFSPGFVHKANIATSLSWKHVSILITLRRSSAKSGEEQSSYNVERLILYYYFSSFWFPRKAGLMRLDKKNATFHFPFLRKKTQHIPILLISLWMVGTGPCRFEGTSSNFFYHRFAVMIRKKQRHSLFYMLLLYFPSSLSPILI